MGYRRACREQGQFRADVRQHPSPQALRCDVRVRAQESSGLNATRHITRFSAVGLLLLLGACTSIPPVRSPGTTSAPPATIANNVLIRAIGLVGTPYRWGGNTPESGFDCSGLVDYVFRSEAGMALPRTSREIAAVDAPKIRRDDLQAGDLLFFGSRHRVNHVAIYVGNGRFVNAPDAGGTVRLDRLDGYYWRNHYLFAKRVLTPRVRAALVAD